MAIKSKITFTRIASSVDYQNLVFSKVALDPDSLNRYLTDAVSFFEELNIVFSKSLEDTASVSERFVNMVGKPFSDATSVGDTALVEFTSVQTDSISISDAIDHIELSKNPTDLGTVTDEISFDYTKGVSDGVSVGDSGIVRGQGYCDLSYFSEDYVGFVQAF